MKWFKTRERLPVHQQEVLVKCRGNVNLARFDKPGESFVLRNGDKLSVKTEALEWTELISPIKKK